MDLLRKKETQAVIETAPQTEMGNLLSGMFEGHNIRWEVRDNEALFVLMDVCNAINISNHRDIASRLKDDEKDAVGITDSIGRIQETIVVNEKGLNKVIFKSNKPEAELFQDWVFGEILPSIRKGTLIQKQPDSYMIADPLERAQAWINEQIQAKEILLLETQEKEKAIKEKAWIADKKTATALVTASHAVRRKNKLEIILDESEQWATIKKVQIATGEKYSYSELRKVSLEMNLPPRKVFDANYGQVNSYNKNIWLEVYSIDITQI